MAYQPTKHFNVRNWPTIPALGQTAKPEGTIGIAFLGQSNLTGQPEAGFDYNSNGESAPDANILEWSQGNARSNQVVPPSGELMIALDPLQHNVVGSVGPCLAMCKTLRKLLPGAPKIMFTANGLANTSYESGRWMPAGDLHEAAVTRTTAMVEANPECQLDIIVVMLGPSDAIAQRTADQFEADATTAVEDFRSRVPGAENAVVVFATPPDSLTAANPGGDPIVLDMGTFPEIADRLQDLASPTGWTDAIPTGFENAGVALMNGLQTHDSTHYTGATYPIVGQRLAAAAIELLNERAQSSGDSYLLKYDAVADDWVMEGNKAVRVSGGSLVADDDYGKVLETPGTASSVGRVDVRLIRPSRSFTVRGKVKILSNSAGDGAPTGVGAQLPLNTQVPIFAGRSDAQESDGENGWFFTTRVSANGSSIVVTDLTQNAEVLVGEWFDVTYSYDHRSQVVNVFVNDTHPVDDVSMGQQIVERAQLMQLGGWGTSTSGYWQLQYQSLEVLPYATSELDHGSWRAELNYVAPVDAELFVTNVDAFRTAKNLTLDGDWRVLATKGGHYGIFYTTAGTPDVTTIGLPWNSAGTAGVGVGVFLLDLNLMTTTQGTVTARAYADPSGAPAADWITREFYGYITRANTSTPWTVYWNDRPILPGDGTKLYYVEVDESTEELLIEEV